jgi:hypothetical protein
MGGDHGIATGGDPEEQVHRLYKELPRRQGRRGRPVYGRMRVQVTQNRIVTETRF